MGAALLPAAMWAPGAAVRGAADAGRRRAALPWPGIEPAFSPLRFVDPWVYGILTTVLGVALLFTAYRGRLAPVGRVTAAIGVVVWVTLAAATPSATSLLIDALVAATLLAEVWTMRSCDDE